MYTYTEVYVYVHSYRPKMYIQYAVSHRCSMHCNHVSQSRESVTLTPKCIYPPLGSYLLVHTHKHLLPSYSSLYMNVCRYVIVHVHTPWPHTLSSLIRLTPEKFIYLHADTLIEFFPSFTSQCYTYTLYELYVPLCYLYPFFSTNPPTNFTPILVQPSHISDPLTFANAHGLTDIQFQPFYTLTPVQYILSFTPYSHTIHTFLPILITRP